MTRKCISAGVSLFALILLLFCVSCASKPKYEGTANVTGMIVDEYNQPVYGFPVSASSGMIVYGTAITNESGIFMIQNVKSGKLSFSGKKDGYAVLDKEETFYQRDKIICFQLPSVDFVLDRIDERILQDDCNGGLNELKTIHAKLGSPVYGVVREYERCCKLGKKMERLRKSRKKSVKAKATSKNPKN